MSELQTRFIDDTYVEYYNTGKNELAQIYLKSEADKVIEELEESHEKEVEQLILTIEQCKRAARTLRKKKEHSNYKRCLAMARWCRMHDEFTQLESERLGLQQRTLFFEYRKKAMWWNKWCKRWLELAEKFKEAK